MTHFRIVHISDLHFSNNAKDLYVLGYKRERLQEALKRLPSDPVRRQVLSYFSLQQVHDVDASFDLAERIYRLCKRTDLILITGDLATTGLAADLSIAKQFCSEQPDADMPYMSLNGTPTLKGKKSQILLLPGNHDRFRDALGARGGRNFDLMFPQQWQAGSDRYQTATLAHRNAAEKLFILMADFCLRKDHDYIPGWHLGQGYADQDILDKMVEKTSRLRNDNPESGVIWAMHFPPIRGADGFAKMMKLRRRDFVIDAASSADVSLILAGHVHKPYDEQGTGVNGGRTNVRVVTAASGCGANESGGNAFNLIDIQVKNGATQVISIEEIPVLSPTI